MTTERRAALAHVFPRAKKM